MLMDPEDGPVPPPFRDGSPSASTNVFPVLSGVIFRVFDDDDVDDTFVMEVGGRMRVIGYAGYEEYCSLTIFGLEMSDLWSSVVSILL